MAGFPNPLRISMTHPRGPARFGGVLAWQKDEFGEPHRTHSSHILRGVTSRVYSPCRERGDVRWGVVPSTCMPSGSSGGGGVKPWNVMRQEPITWSVQLTYFRATAFSQVRLYLD